MLQFMFFGNIRARAAHSGFFSSRCDGMHGTCFNSRGSELGSPLRGGLYFVRGVALGR